MTDELDLEHVLRFSTGLARKAGELITRGSRAILSANPGNVNEKANSVDLVTEWDVAVEKLVQSEIAITYPTFKFMGEENYSAGNEERLTDDPTFIVDPIDGTTNFVHGFPFVCISIGFVLKKKPIIGVIYNPFLDQLYHGRTGHGSFLTQGSTTLRLPLMSPREFPSLASALIAVEWGSDRSKVVMERKSKSFLKLAADSKEVIGAKMCHSLRSVGSAALNFAMVASGTLDIYWEIGCWPWDVSAGIVIAQESGCFVSGSPESKHDGDVGENILTGRKSIVIRAVHEHGGGIQRQKELIKEFYETVEDWDAA